MFRRCFRLLLHETIYPTHFFTMNLSKNETSWLCKMVESVDTNHLKMLLFFNQGRLLRKRNLVRVPDGRLADVTVDLKLVIERDRASLMA